MKQRIINIVLWVAFILAMVASIQHLAWTFGTVEQKGHEWMGWLPAIAVDAGLAALAYTIQQRKKADKTTVVLWCGVFGFAAVSALANFYHALSMEGTPILATWIVYAKALVLSATLPVAYIFLGEIISNDDAGVIANAETERKRQQDREDREQRRKDREQENQQKQIELEQRRLEVEQQRIALEQAKQQEQAAQAEEQAAQEANALVLCNTCGRTFKSIKARNAHKCEAKQNGFLHREEAVKHE